MKKTYLALGCALLAGFTAAANAAYIDYVWADSVTEWNGGIKNFSMDLMTKDTTWWLTGQPDADQNGNGYAWDPVDNDYVAGWKMPFSNDRFTVSFDTPIQDGAGDDILVVGYGGPACEASVQASSDGINFTELGTIVGGTPGYLNDLWFDLGGLSDIQYIRVERVSGAAYSAAFVDAIGAVPEPASGMLLILGGLCVAARRR